MEKIYEILKQLRPEFDFYTSSDYINDGMLDSFDIVTLTSELEEKFNILIDALDLVPENFCSAEAIAEVIKKNGGEL